MRRLAVAALSVLVLAPAALAAPPTGPVYDREGRLIQTPLAPERRPARVPLVLGEPLVLQPRRHLHERSARLSAAPLPARPLRVDRPPRPFVARTAFLARLVAPRRDRLPDGLQDRAERR